MADAPSRRLTFTEAIQELAAQLEALHYWARVDIQNRAEATCHCVEKMQRLVVAIHPTFSSAVVSFNGLGGLNDSVTLRDMPRPSAHAAVMVDACYLLDVLWFNLDPEGHKAWIDRVDAGDEGAAYQAGAAAAFELDASEIVSQWDLASAVVRGITPDGWQKQLQGVRVRLTREQAAIEGQQNGYGPTCDSPEPQNNDAPLQETFRPAEVQEMIGLSPSKIREHRQEIDLPGPPPGGKGKTYRYPRADLIQLLAHVAKTSGDKDARDRCSGHLKRLTRIEI